MSTQSIEPTSRAVAIGPNKTESTTARSAILKQIATLQKSAAALSSQLAALGDDYDTIQQRMALQQQIQAVQAQIAALQIALLQLDADRQVQVSKTDEVKTMAVRSDAPTPPSSDTLGSVIDTVA